MFDYSISPTCTHVKLDIGLSYSAPQAQTWLSHEDAGLMVFGFEPNPDSIACILNKNNKTQHPLHGGCLQYKYIDLLRQIIHSQTTLREIL